MQGRVGVLRIGQLCGDTQAGVWNESEGWPLLLRTMDEVGCLPDLEEDVVWLPVDVAATAILEAALAGVKRPSPSLPDQVPVYHIMNPLTTPWSQVLLWAQESGKSFRIVSRQDWISAMQGSDPDVSKNPSRKLLQMWEARVCFFYLTLKRGANTDYCIVQPTVSTRARTCLYYLRVNVSIPDVQGSTPDHR